MEIKAGESKQVSVEIPADSVSVGDVMEFQVSYKCVGCGHDHKKVVEVKWPAKDIKVGFACPCCTPWWMKLRNFIYRVFLSVSR